MARFSQDETDPLERAWQQADASLNPTPAPVSPTPAPDVTAGPSPWTENNPYDQQPTPTPRPAPGQAAGGAGDFTQDLGPGASSGGGAFSSPGVPVSAIGSANSYQSYLDSINGATDPRQQLVARDGLARQLQSDLEADGHTIKWNGDTLMIDGRPYELGSGASSGNRETDLESPLGGVPSPTAGSSGSSTPWVPTDIPKGMQWDPNVAGFVPTNIPLDPSGYVMQGGQLVGKANPGARVETGASNPLSWVDDTLAEVQSTDDLQQWYRYIQADPKAMAGDPSAIEYWKDRIRRGDGSMLVKNGTLTKFQDGASAGAGGRGGAVSNTYDFNSLWNSMPDFLKNWSPQAAQYQPDAIDTNLDELPGFDEIYKLLSKDDPEEAKLSGLVNNILEHPESLSDTDVEMLKAQNAEETALAGQAQDEELQHFGAQAGLSDSPWLAGQRSQNAWDRRQATIGSNRTVDIAAANQRQSDRLAAASLGQGFAQYRTAKGQQALNIAVEGALGKASEQRGRKALNESMKQAATQLGLSRDQLVLGYITNNLSFLRDNKSLDLGYDIDIKKLSEQSDEFRQTLAQRIAEMKQADDQFKANYGLAVQSFNHNVDQDYWERAKAAAG